MAAPPLDSSENINEPSSTSPSPPHPPRNAIVGPRREGSHQGMAQDKVRPGPTLQPGDVSERSREHPGPSPAPSQQGPAPSQQGLPIPNLLRSPRTLWRNPPKRPATVGWQRSRLSDVSAGWVLVIPRAQGFEQACHPSRRSEDPATQRGSLKPARRNAPGSRAPHAMSPVRAAQPRRPGMIHGRARSGFPLAIARLEPAKNVGERLFCDGARGVPTAPRRRCHFPSRPFLLRVLRAAEAFHPGIDLRLSFRPVGATPRGRPYAGSCWEMQWNDPSPQIRSDESTPITRRPPNRSCKIPTATSSFACRNVGTTTTPFAM